ncbi:MAG: hypothetical protein HDQ97_07435 [Lachnospiraceae bacterium]|nr:hypothetical protein [Lachnospiraceae bacterium]
MSIKIGKIEWIKKYIKLKVAYPHFAEIFFKLLKSEDKRAVLIGTPVHSNLGDHLIAKECMIFLKKKYNFVIEVPEFVYELFPNKIVTNKDDDIFIVGGGWMGDLYEDECVVEDIIERFPNNSITILPQTVYFDKGNYSSVKQLRKVLKRAKNITFCLREEQSYNFCIANFSMPNIKILLKPDMALLALNNIVKKNNRSNVIYLSLRNDAEKSINIDDIDRIRRLPQFLDYSFIETSTVIKKKIVSINKRDKEIKSMINQFSNGKLVITDRLHTMVFALLAGTPCIIYDNLTHKVGGIYKTWLKDMPGLIYMDQNSISLAEIIASILKSSEMPIERDYWNYFTDIINERH